MLETYNYKTALLLLFIKSMGDGFTKIICHYWPYPKTMTPNNFKQKIAKMNSGDYESYREISYALINCKDIFTSPSYKIHNSLYNNDVKEIKTDTSFCPEDGSDKYYFNFRDFFYIFKSADNIDDDFFYESFENTLSYLIAKEFYTVFSFEDYNDEKSKMAEENQIPSSETPEYPFSIYDVRFNKRENKTFFKWVIVDFYSHVNDKSKADEIIKIIFGDNDGSIPKTFEGLKYYSKKRKWETFEKLFKNEQNNEKLMKFLAEPELLSAYQIFQSRMFVAYFLENLCNELPNFVGDENAQELIKIITGDVSRKKPEYFLIENHKEKTETYKNQVWDLIENKSKRNVESLDKDCLATETINAYLNLLSCKFYFEVKKNSVLSTNEYLEICKKNPRFLEPFANTCYTASNFKFSVTSSLNGFLWTKEDYYF